MTKDFIKDYIEDLFKYITVYEESYGQFETEAFFQTYNGIYTVFQTLREQRDKAVEVDYYFLDKVRATPLTQSDLRQLTLQTLITYFESEADTDGRSNQAYAHCRGLRAAKQDVPYFETNLIPLLFKDGALKDNFRLHAFFLREIARYINRFGKKVKAEITPEEFNALSEPLKFLELMRRRVELGDDLLKDRESLEFHLLRVDAFAKLGTRSKTYKQYLSEWGYLKKSDFWSRVASWFGELGAKFRGAFSSGKYSRLVISQRKPAYFFYTAVILLFLLAAIMVPRWWSSYTEKKLEGLKERATKVQKGIGG